MISAWSSYQSNVAATVSISALYVRTTVRLAALVWRYCCVLLRALGPRCLLTKIIPSHASLRKSVRLAPAQALRSETRDALGEREENPVQLVVTHPPVGYPTQITDPRVRQLQAATLRRVFIERYGIFPTDTDLFLLSQWGSAAWVVHNLLNAAGFSHGAVVTETEYLFRCKVVYPAVVRTLGIKPPAPPTAAGSGSTEAGISRARYDPTIRNSIFPREVENYRQAVTRQQTERATRRAYRRTQREEALNRFALYCWAISALASHHGTQNSLKHRRALHALEALTTHTGGHYGYMESRKTSGRN